MYTNTFIEELDVIRNINHDMKSKRWQLISNDQVWMFPVELELRTTEMPEELLDIITYRYESCIFRARDSEVLNRYLTKDEAIIGHRTLEKEYGLKRVE